MAASITTTDESWKNEIQKWPPQKCVPLLHKSLQSFNDDELTCKQEKIKEISLEIFKRLNILHQLTSYQQQTQELSKSILLYPCIMFLYENKDSESAVELINKVYAYLKANLFQILHGTGMISRLKEISSEDLKNSLAPLKEIFNNHDELVRFAVLHFCQMMLKEVLQWQADNGAQISIKFLSQLCYLCGLSIESEEISKSSLELITEFLEIASDSTSTLVTTNSSSRDVKSWLFKLINSLLNMSVDDVCHPYWYKCIIAIIKIDPTVAMSKMGPLITKSLFSVNSENWNTNLDAFIKKICQLYENLRQMPKFFTILMTCIKEYVKGNKFMKTGSLLCDEVINRIEVTFLPPGQIFQIWQEILNTIKFFQLKRKSNDSTTGITNGYITILHFFQHFLSSVKLSDNSLPIGLVPKLIQLMKTTQEDAISNAVKAVNKYQEDQPLINAVLDVMYVWGELEILLHQYCFRYKSSVTLENCNKEDLYDLSLVHCNIPQAEIKQLLLFAINFEDDKSTLFRFLSLMIQRLRCLFLLMNESKENDKIITDIIDFIFQHISSKVPCPHLSKEYVSVDFGTAVAKLMLENMKICYLYLKPKQLRNIVDLAVHSNEIRSLITLLKCEDSLSQGIESCVISSMLTALSTSIIYRGIKRESFDGDFSPVDHLKILFQTSALNKKAEEISEVKVLKQLSKKFIEVQKLADQINAKNSPTIEANQVIKTFKFMKSTPMEFLSPSNTIDLYIGTLTLYILLIKQKKRLTVELLPECTELLLVLTDCCKNHTLFMNCCDGSSLLQLLLSNPFYQSKSKVYTEMLINYIFMIMSDKEQFAKIENLVSTKCSEQNIELVLTLMETLVKGINEGIGSTRISRQYFWKLAKVFIPVSTVSCEVVRAYTFMIEVSNSRDKFVGQQIDISDWKSCLPDVIERVFEQFIDQDLSMKIECLKLVATIWLFKQALITCPQKEKELIMKTIKMLVLKEDDENKINECAVLARKHCLQKIIDNSSLDAFRCSVDLLLSQTICCNNVTESSSHITIWTDIVAACQDKAKVSILIPHVNKLFVKIYSILHEFNVKVTSEQLRMVTASLKMQIKCANQEKLVNLELAHTFLQGCQLLPIRYLCEERKYAELFDTMMLCCELLNQLLMKHTAQVLRAAPVFLFILNHLVDVTVMCADQDQVISGQYDASILKLANSLTRLLVQFSSHKKHVDKILCSVISQYVTSVCKVTILPAVKNMLQQGIHACLASADPHTIDHLRIASNSSSREVFKSLHENYINHHKYTGKV